MPEGCCQPSLWLRFSCSSAVAYRSLVSSLVFGTAITLVHQGGSLGKGAAPIWWQAVATYAIVYLTACVAIVSMQLSTQVHTHKQRQHPDHHIQGAFLQGPAYQRMYSASSANAWFSLNPPGSTPHNMLGPHQHLDSAAMLQAAALQYAQHLQGYSVGFGALGSEHGTFGVAPKDQPVPSVGPTPRRAPGIMDTATTADLSGLPSARSQPPHSSRSKGSGKYQDVEAESVLMLSARSGASELPRASSGRAKQRSMGGSAQTEAISLLDQPQTPNAQASPFSVLASSQSPFSMSARARSAAQAANPTAPRSSTSVPNPLQPTSSAIARSSSLSSITSILRAESLEPAANLSTASSLGLVPGDLSNRPSLADIAGQHNSLTNRTTNPSSPRSPSASQLGALSRPGSIAAWSSPQRGVVVAASVPQLSFISSPSMTYQPSPLAARLPLEPAYPDASQQNPDRLMLHNPLAVSGDFSSFTGISLGPSQTSLLERSLGSRSEQSISLSGTGNTNMLASGQSVISVHSTRSSPVKMQKAHVSAVPGMEAYSNWLFQQQQQQQQQQAQGTGTHTSRLGKAPGADPAGEATEAEARNRRTSQ